MNTPSDNIQPLTSELDLLRRRLDRAERRARLSWACALSALALTVLLNVRPAALAQSPGVNLAKLASEVSTLMAQVSALQTKTAALTQTGAPGSSGALLTVKGDNVQIVDGTGNTDSTSSLGNLTIGYNAKGNYYGDVRTGSHNLILGDENSYSSYGGLIAGTGNTISGQYATVTGGRNNTASGQYATVTGGGINVASGQYATVTGGGQNTASGIEASIIGGYYNTASGETASATGGFLNTASGTDASVSGGQQNTAGGDLSSVSGGYDIVYNVDYGWAGGSYHTP